MGLRMNTFRGNKWALRWLWLWKGVLGQLKGARGRLVVQVLGHPERSVDCWGSGVESTQGEGPGGNSAPKNHTVRAGLLGKGKEDS